MARISSPLFNAATGRIGNTVFKNVSTAKGRAVDAAAYQPVVANPQTPAQMRQRILFGTAAKLAGGLSASNGMRNLYTLSIDNKNQFTWFVQNFLSVSNQIETVQSPDFPLGGIAETGELASGQSLSQAVVRYTQGALSFTQVNQIAVDEYAGSEGAIRFIDANWSTNLGPVDSAEDKLIFWAIDLFSGQTFTEDTGLTRSQGDENNNIDIAPNAVLLTSNNFRVMGFSFFREDQNGVTWSQVSYPKMSLNGSTVEILPNVISGAYNTAANRPIPPTQWGIN